MPAEGRTYWDDGTERFMTVVDAWPGAVTSREATHAEIRAMVDAVIQAARATSTRRFKVCGGGEAIGLLSADEAGATVAAMIKRGVHPGNIQIGEWS